MCNRIQTESNGIIQSPIINGYYPPNLDCTIDIQTEKLSKIQIYFSKFDVENSPNCVNDFMQVNNGPKLCGNKLPDPVFSSTNTAKIIFRSNDRVEGNCNITINFLLNSCCRIWI